MGTSAIQASGQRLRSGKEIMRSIEESKATPQSASDGVSQRMRVANPEIRVAVPAGSSEGVATASCIGAEFIKSLIDPGKFPQRLPIVERDREERPVFDSVTLRRNLSL